MPNSKYPQELDTSIEIPVVRDNITEIGSDVINSLRSAIFNIEKTLGINPQGAAGNSVSSRLSTSLDSNGNIKSDALMQANVLTGPIIDNNVSGVASIKESKLKLDFPTKFLQSEISILSAELSGIKEKIVEVSNALSIHIDPRSLNRHKALSISVDSESVSESDIATLSIQADNLQNILSEIYNSHINYTGANISELNNSHKANQIYFDKSEISDIIFSTDVQSAIEDLANIESVGFRNALLNTTSNGRIRSGSVLDDFEQNENNSILIDSATVTYLQSNGNSTTTFTYSTGQNTLGSISRFDILKLSGSETESDNKEYQILGFTTDGNGLVKDVIVYGGPKSSSTSGLTAQIIKNQYTSYNSAGFSCVVRPRSLKTNTPDVQYLNPDSATIISNGINTTKINSTSHTFNITIDDNDPVTINTYSSAVSTQTIDSIITKINDQFVDQHLNATAFKVRSGNCYEIAIAHNIPNISGDIKNRTLKLNLGSTNDGTTNLGFSNILGTTFEGSSKNSLNLNGFILSGFGLIQDLNESLIQLNPGTNTLSLYSGNFSDLGVRIGDLIVITGASDGSDDGTFRVGSILNNTITIDLSGFIFSSELSENSKVYIIRSTANIGELTFEEILTTDGTIIFDVFISDEKDIFYSKRMEIDGLLSSGSFNAAISDVSKNFIKSGETATLNITTSGYATLTDPNLESGESVYVGTTGFYKIFGGDGLSFVTLDVNANGLPLTAQSVTLYGFNEISSNNYHLCRGGFSTGLGRVLGTSTDPGIPTLIDKRISGTVDHTIISETFIEKYIEGPRNELRSSGVIKGCDVINTTFAGTYQTFDVSPGILIVNGIRREFSGQSGIRINTADSYIVVMDEYGCIKASTFIDNPLNPGNDISTFFENNVAYLAEVTNNGSTTTVYDLRLFIDNLDFKLLNTVSVSNDKQHAHFTDIKKAVNYCKRFSKMFPDMGIPTLFIKQGEYEIGETILIDFDLKIIGSGPTTKLTKTSSFAIGSALTGDNFDMRTSIFMIGGGSASNADDIEYGVSISDLTYYTSNSITNVGVVFALTQPIVKSSTVISRRATYNFQNIIFDGPSAIDGSAADPNKIGEFALVVGQQNSSTLSPIGNLEMGNIIFTNCRLNRMGLETGAIKFTESSSSTFKDIIVSNNIITRASPNVSSSDAIIIEYPTTPSLENVIETNNTFRTGS